MKGYKGEIMLYTWDEYTLQRLSPQITSHRVNTLKKAVKANCFGSRGEKDSFELGS